MRQITVILKAEYLSRLPNPGYEGGRRGPDGRCQRSHDEEEICGS